MRVQISAVIITHNEERNIGRCLESLQGVADELVVVDSYSTDRTEEICHSYDALFIRHRFQGYIEQKNWAVLQASSPYILSLDADEALSAQLRESILRIKENWTHDAYYFNRLTSYCGKWIRRTSWYPSRKLRLWDSRKGSWGGINPHDKYLLTRGASSKFLKGDLLHYSYYSKEEHLKQINSFSSIMARSYFEEGKRVGLMGIYLRPAWRFLRDYILLLGFMDGSYGYLISKIGAREVFLKYLKLRKLYRAEKESRKGTICFFNTHETWGGGERWHLDIISVMDRQAYRIIYISSPGSPLSKKLDELEVRGYQLSLKNLSFLNPIKMYHLIRIFRREAVGVLISNLSNDMKFCSLAGKLAGIPHIIYRRGSAIPVRNSMLNRYLFRKVLTDVLANSHETRRTILANNSDLVDEDKIKVVYNGVDLSRYPRETAPQYRPDSGEIVLGCAGRLSEEKGLHYLLEMMSLLAGDSLNYRLLIAGDGKIKQELMAKSTELGVDGKVDFLGFVENMPSFYASIDIFLLPSRYEGFGYVIAEAMASWKPVVAFDIKSSAEIVKHGQTGYLVPLNQVEEMKARVQELARNKELREHMGEKGRTRVEKLFSLNKNLQAFLEMFSPQRE